MIKANGSGKVIIPAGVTINIDGSFQLDQDGGCDSGSPCTFEIEVQGTLNVDGNLQNNLEDLVWSGVGTVNVDGNFENSSNGCMNCAVGTCPAFPSGSGCSDSGSGCSIDFCTDGNYGNNNPLPVELTSFTGNYLNGNVNLQWETATELNNDYFTVERSRNGILFEILGTVAGNGTAKTPSFYDFTDNSPIAPLTYYRLRQTDYDGAFEVFPPIVVDVTGNELRIYPTLLNTDDVLKINTSLFNANQFPLNIDLYDPSGRVVLQATIPQEGIAAIPLDNIHTAGIYLVKVNGTFDTRLVIGN